MERDKQTEFENEIRQKAAEMIRTSLTDAWRVESLADRRDALKIYRAENPESSLLIQLGTLFEKVEKNESEQENILSAFAANVKKTLAQTGKEHKIRGNEGRIYPVIRHASFPTASDRNAAFVFREHTAETVVAYALDLGESYILITREMLQKAGMTEEELHQAALSNVKKLENSPSTDRIGDNVFYFLTGKDSYSASRVLDTELLDTMAGRMKGKMGVAIPHQDVLIFADLADAKGAYMLSQIAVDFSMRGTIPITPIPFMYEESVLEPYMVMRNPSSRHKYPSMGGKKKRPSDS
ncbi:DUF1444 family protein [Aneurinibacillus tyrosinisolvens]|uniref:DUF1444 family protein n=1 Tax=Aneurinibacillus tyrosinisolvens TaxID=1443435 RepID=UPI00069A7EB3|nr:DUF1444 family protein [Aneurinibacillus tyrosinisolvens]